MKRFVCVLLILTIFAFSGCTSETSETKKETTRKTESQIEPFREDTITKDIDVSIETQAEKEIKTKDILDKYAKIYDTYISFPDMYVMEKHLLIGDDNVVELFIIGDFCDVVSISRKDVEHIEHSVFREFASITIYDKTKKTISLTVAPDNLNNILEILN